MSVPSVGCPHVGTFLFAGARAYVQSLLRPALNNIRMTHFSCHRVVWHNVLAGHVAKTALLDLKEASLDSARSFLRDREASRVPERLARRELRREADRLQRLQQSVALLLEALSHEAAFGRFANRDYAMARAMEDGDPIDGDLEDKWEEVVLAKARRDRDRKRRESLQKGAAKSPGATTSGKTDKQPASHNSRRTSSANRNRNSGGQKTGRPGAQHPCYECGKSDHWLEDCPEAKKKKKD